MLNNNLTNQVWARGSWLFALQSYSYLRGSIGFIWTLVEGSAVCFNNRIGPAFVIKSNRISSV